MYPQIAKLPTPDLSGFAPLVGSAVSMIGMLIIVAGSAIHMMV